jgi:exonuclease III
MKGYSGTAIFTKVKPLKVINDIGIDEHDKEGRSITLEFEKFYLLCTYVPNASQKLKRLEYRYAIALIPKFRVNQWDKDLQGFIANLEKSGKPVIWCGDLNVC